MTSQMLCCHLLDRSGFTPNERKWLTLYTIYFFIVIFFTVVCYTYSRLLLGQLTSADWNNNVVKKWLQTHTGTVTLSHVSAGVSIKINVQHFYKQPFTFRHAFNSQTTKPFHNLTNRKVWIVSASRMHAGTCAHRLESMYRTDSCARAARPY